MLDGTPGGKSLSAGRSAREPTLAAAVPTASVEAGRSEREIYGFILYQAGDPAYWFIWLFVLFALMAFNELGRVKLWGGVALFVIVPVFLTIFIWPTTAAPATNTARAPGSTGLRPTRRSPDASASWRCAS